MCSTLVRFSSSINTDPYRIDYYSESDKELLSLSEYLKKVKLGIGLRKDILNSSKYNASNSLLRIAVDESSQRQSKVNSAEMKVRTHDLSFALKPVRKKELSGINKRMTCTRIHESSYTSPIADINLY